MNQAHECPGCDQLTRDVLCVACVAWVERIVAKMPDAVADLELTRTRQARGARSSGHRDKGEAAPLPFDDRPQVAEAIRHVAIFIEWAEHIARTCHYPISALPVPVTPPNDLGLRRVADATDLILRNLGWFRVAPDAPKAMKALGMIRDRLRAAVDRPPARVYLGPCGAAVTALEVTEVDGVIVPRTVTTVCATPLYAATGDGVVTCRTCGAQRAPAERKAFRRAAFEGEVLPLGDVLDGLRDLAGLEVDRALIRQWRRRGKLVTCLAGGVEMYRVADVLRLASGTRQCSEPECSDLHYARGLCARHYQQTRRARSA